MTTTELIKSQKKMGGSRYECYDIHPKVVACYGQRGCGQDAYANAVLVFEYISTEAVGHQPSENW